MLDTIERPKTNTPPAPKGHDSSQRVAAAERAGNLGIATAAGGAAIGAVAGPETAILGAVIGAIVGLILGRRRGF